MSLEHPIIAVTGSSGAGTTTVRSAFEHIFARLLRMLSWSSGRSCTPSPRSELSSHASNPADLNACSIRAAAAAVAEEWLMKTVCTAGLRAECTLWA